MMAVTHSKSIWLQRVLQHRNYDGGTNERRSSWVRRRSMHGHAVPGFERCIWHYWHRDVTRYSRAWDRHNRRSSTVVPIVLIGAHSEGEFSKILEVLFGAPQGSVLGPILFNIYVRGQPLVFQACNFKSTSFADDSNGSKTFSLEF